MELNQSQLQRLKNHKYSCHSESLFDSFMQHWWHWLLSKTPLNVAPNLITITGLAINIASALVLVYYSPDAKQEVPKWACFQCALGLFIYQSLDAIDGKQARRIGQSSPLGELFDHGCDSLSTIFVSISVCCAVQLGNHPYWMFFQCMMAITLFYCAHWQTYVSGTLRFGLIDVTEAQFGVMSILLVSSIFGSTFWSMKVMDSLAMMCVPTIIGSLAGFIALFNNLKIILIEEGAGRNGSTVAGTSVLSPVVSLVATLFPAAYIALNSPNELYEQNPTLYLLTFGFVGARVTNRLVVAHMTKSEMAYTDMSMFGPLALYINQYFFNCFIPEKILLWLVFVWVLFDLLHYCHKVCLEICNFLKIRLFVIEPPKVTSPSSRETNGNSSRIVTRSKSKGKVN